MSHDHDPTSPLVIFGDELRHHREAAGLTQLQVADALGYTEGQVGHIENGRRKPSEKAAKGSDTLFGTGGLFVRLYDRVQRMPSYPTWFGPWAEAERTADSVHNYQPLLVAGLLQTRDYAYRTLRGGRPRDTEERIEELLAARLERQQLLTAEDSGNFWFVLDEGVLRRRIGTPDVMSTQLEHILEQAELPSVNVQVVPQDAGERPGLSGAFAIASFRDRPDIVYLETAGPAQILAEPRQVTRIKYEYDALQMHTLPVAASLKLIREVAAEQWT